MSHYHTTDFYHYVNNKTAFHVLRVVCYSSTAQQQLMSADTIITCKSCHGGSVLQDFTLIEAGIHSKSFRSDHQLNVSCSTACHFLQRNSDLRDLLDMSVWTQRNNRIEFTAEFCQLWSTHTNRQRTVYIVADRIFLFLLQRSNWRGSESSTLEIDVYVWRYALIVVHARNEWTNECYRAKNMLPNYGCMWLKGSPRSCTTADYVAIDDKE